MWVFKALAMGDRKCYLTISIHVFISLSFLFPEMGAVSNETDRLALLEFKAKITYDPLGIMGLWNDTTNFCEWYGVVCSSRHQRVAELNLFSLELAGSISPHIGNLSFLHVLKLENNILVHQIPPEVGRLRRLQVLYLHNNLLCGVIPPNMSSCSELRHLNLSNNKLEGEIPVGLGFLSKLQVFAADNNHLWGCLPSNLFHKIPNLQRVSFTRNQLIGPIPASLSNASNLQHLDFAANNFTGKVPSLKLLGKLNWFSISKNKLGSGAGAQDDLNFLCSLVNATALEYLLIQGNNFGGTLPGCITNLSSQLLYLSISGNFITGSIPPGIGNFTRLVGLWLTYTSISDAIPPTIGNLKNLAILELYGNNLSGHIPPSLGNLSKLIQLDLSFNILEGKIPSSLHTCTSLQILYLHDNKLTGIIPPQVLTIPSLTIALDLSHNQLSGPLPKEVGKLSGINGLGLSCNKLSGEIPSSLGECTSLVKLYLGHNNFQGSIPSSLSSLRGLQYLDVSSNNLSGQIPEFLSSFNLTMLNISFNHLEGLVPSKGVFKNSSATSLEGNHKLCGGLPDFHLPACKERRTSTTARVIIATVAGLSGVAVLIIVLSLLRLRRKPCQGEVTRLSDNPPFPFVSYGDLHRATNGFAEGNLIGSGSFGSVYKGVIGAEEQVVAVKVLDLKRVGATRSFAAECEALRNMRHRNLVKILTVCSGTDHLGNDFKALVYEFMPNRSLEEWLHPALDEQVPQRKLGLLQRLNIAIDVASLLEYAHRQLGTPLVHCDIKPSNILLDDELSGRVSDFGLAKFLHNSIQSSSSYGVRGTVGYAPPEYGMGSQVSTQGDVYSYGILLLQMLTGKRPTDEVFKEGLSLHLYARLGLQRNVVEILDPILLQDLLDNVDQVWDANLNNLIHNPRRENRSRHNSD